VRKKRRKKKPRVLHNVDGISRIRREKCAKKTREEGREEARKERQREREREREGAVYVKSSPGI